MDFRDAPTQWSLIEELQHGPDRALAWNRFYFTYSEPIITFVMRRFPQKVGRVVRRPEAEDIAQTFVSDCFAGRWLDKADPARGHFRSLFVTILDRYLSKQARAGAKAHDAGVMVYSIQGGLDDDDRAEEIAVDDSVVSHFEREWIRVQVAQSMARLHEARPAEYDVLRATMAGLDDAAIAEQHGLRRSNVRKRRERARATLRNYYSEIAAQTASPGIEFDRELELLDELLDSSIEDLPPGEGGSGSGS